MAIGVESVSVDLDSILAQLGAFTPIANIGIRYGSSNIDIATRYLPIYYGAAVGPTNIKVGSPAKDLNALFAGLGTTLTISIPSSQGGGSALTLNGSTLVTVSGGTSPFTYSWAHTAATGGGTFSITSGQGTNEIFWTITSPSTKTTTTYVTCTVTSATGYSLVSNTDTIQLVD